MMKGSIQEEDITIVNIYAPNVEGSQYISPNANSYKWGNQE